MHEMIVILILTVLTLEYIKPSVRSQRSFDAWSRIIKILAILLQYGIYATFAGVGFYVTLFVRTYDSRYIYNALFCALSVLVIQVLLVNVLLYMHSYTYRKAKQCTQQC